MHRKLSQTQEHKLSQQVDLIKKFSALGPVQQAHLAFGIPMDYLWWGAQGMLLSVFQNPLTAVQTGHSMSKDYIGGIAAVQWLMKYPYNSKVICIAPKLDQVKLIMFGEIRKQFAALQMSLPWPIAGDDAMKILMLELGEAWYAVGMTTKQTGQNVGKLQGFKSPNLLIIVSEAQSVDDNIYDQFVGMTTSGNAHVVELGNPVAPAGRFYEHCTNPKFRYHVIKLSCFQSPNVVAGREVIPGMVTKEWIDLRHKEWGPNHPYWISRVEGEFPQTSKDCIIPLAWIMRQVCGDDQIHRHNADFLQEEDPEDNTKVGGLDVSKMGNDETVHVVFTGPKLSRLDPFHKVEISETVGWAKAIAVEERLAAMAIDEGGLAGVASFLEEDDAVRTTILKIHFGSKFEDNADFDNLGAKMWWGLREAFEKGEIWIPDDPILIAQLSSRKFTYTSVGKKVIKLESKKNAEEDSPDRGDATAMAWWARRLFRAAVIPAPKFERESARVDRQVDETLGAKSMSKDLSSFENAASNRDMDIV